MITKNELKEKFETFNELKSELMGLCQEYINKNEIRKGETFTDFFMIDDDNIGLLFTDECGNPCIVYSGVKIENLILKEI